MKDMTRKRIGDDCCRLSGLHLRQLIFLEIRVDPQAMRRNDGQQIGALRYVGPDLRSAIADIAVDRRHDLRVAEIEPSGPRSNCSLPV